MTTKQRYSRLSDFLQLIMLMQSKINGVTIQDIQEEFNISRRTAERMKDCLISILPHVQEINSHDKVKRWGFTNFSFKDIIYFSKNDIEILENLSKKIDIQNIKSFKNIINKINILNSTQNYSLKNEIEFLFLSEDIGIRENSKYKIDINIFSIIREGIKKGLKISLNYEGKPKLLEPLGIIFGEKIKLIAREKRKNNKENIFYLHKFENVALTNNHFDKNDFDINKYESKISLENTENISLFFTKDMKNEILNYNFGTSQRIKQIDEKGYRINFKSNINKELFENLFMWGNKVKILAPEELKDGYKNYLLEILKEL